MLATTGTLRALAASIVYVFAYVALDWISYLQPFGGFAITAWNPGTGASLTLVLLAGRRFVPLLFAAPLLADALVRGMPAPWPIEIGLAAVIAIGYGAAGYALTSPKLGFDQSLKAGHDVLLLVLVSTAAAAAVTTAYVGILVASNLVASADFWQAALRLCIGDLIGILVLTPLALVLVRGEARLAFDWETVLQMMAIIACLMLIRSRTNNPELHVFYLMFLPVVWMAGRHGLAGAVTAVALAQVGLILTIANLAHTVFDLTTYQGMMLVLALTGLALGITVNERRRSEQQLRAQQESYARLSRIDTIGEFSVSLAHEINQPLTAAATYARLAIEDLEQPADAGRTAARENIFRSLRQIERASDIVRQLRAFIQRGPSRREAASLNQLIDEAIEMTRLEIERTNTQIVRDEAAELMVPAVEADPMQIKQVLINLLTNALAAVRRTARGQPRLHIATKLAADGFIDVRIEDNGPGFAADILSRPFEPFGTARTEGLGVGLALCRSIVEAHGGRIWLDNTAGGAVVGFTLKAIEEDP